MTELNKNKMKKENKFNELYLENKKRPSFFILGAPKCGTTSLSKWLSMHKNIFMPKIKEPHYFNFDDEHRNITDKKKYLKLFDKMTDEHQISGESSVWYLSSKEAVKNIIKFEKNVKFIIMLRNSVDMAQSLHQQNIFGNYEDEKDFKKAWDLQEERSLGLSIPRTCRDRRHLQYSEACKLGSQIQNILRYVSVENIKFIFLEDLRREPKVVYDSVLEFLNIDNDARVDFNNYNQAKTYRSKKLNYLIILLSRIKRNIGITSSFGISHLNTKKQTRKKITNSFRMELIVHFKSDIHLIEKLTNRCLSGWLV